MGVRARSPEARALMSHPESERGNALASFVTMLNALASPEAFPPEAHAITTIVARHTHASAVLLTDTHAYKLKKPLDLGFLNYSTLERRRACCLEELAINQPLAGSVYLGIAPVLRSPHGALSFGATADADNTPESGARIDGRVVVDFAVVMRRLPDSRSLAALLASGSVENALISAVASALARFHLATDVAPANPPYSAVTDVLANMRQTVDQAAADIGETIEADEHATIAMFIEQFSARRRSLLELRVRDGWVRDGHGDVRLEHVYINPWDDSVDATDATAPKILLVDRIEFDPRFRIGDVAGEMAFLEVELEAAGRADLARAFVGAYVKAIGDKGLLEVAPFYRVYRALVRGKVRALYATQQRSAAAREESRTFYELAARYAAAPVAPGVVLIGGLMGSGKSTFARMLSDELGWDVRSSDVTRKRLASLPATAPISDPDRAALYTSNWDRRVYRQLAADMASSLASGRSIIVDATCSSRARRRVFARLARDAGARAIFIECVCPREVAMARLQARWDAKTALLGAPDEAIYASDGRPALYDAQARRWEPFSDATESGLAHAVIDTTCSRGHQLERALQALGIPRSVCILG
jgi:uncharacterized protein